MPAHRSILTLSAITGIVLLSATAAEAADPTGIWLNDTGRGAIEIKNCGGSLCGHVVWVKDTGDTKGCGRQIIGNAAKVGANTWDNGWIYNPDKKKKYDVELKPLSNGTLQVTGYAGTKLFSKTMIWKRAPANLVRCGSEQTVAKIDPKANIDPKAKVEAKAKPEAVAKPETKTPAKKDVAAAKPETTIVPPAPKPAERPAKKTADPAPAAPVEVARSEPAPAPAAKSDPASEAAPAPTEQEPPQVHALPGVKDEKDAPVVAAEEEDADEPRIDMGKIAKRLAELERETGYGLKKSGNGNCRLKVPYATVNFPCRD